MGYARCWCGPLEQTSLMPRYLAGWGRSVIVGRAKLGGIPMGVIAVETRALAGGKSMPSVT